MKFLKFIAERRLNYLDLLIISIAVEAFKGDMWLGALVLSVIGGFVSVVIERKAGRS